MRNGFLGLLALVFAGAGAAPAQDPAPGSLLLPSRPPAAVSAGGSAALPPSAGSPIPVPRIGVPAEPLCEPAGPGPCGPPGQFWVRGEYLLWWTKTGPVPPLVTTSPAGTAPGSAGVVGAPGTTVLVGNSNLDFEERSGARFTAGFWLDECRTHGLEGGYFFLGSREADFRLASSGVPILARPFVNAVTGAGASELTAFPGLARGSLVILTSNRLEGAELNYLCNLCCCGGCDHGYRLDVLGGFRYLELNEGIGIAESVRVSPASPVLPGAQVDVFDQFDTRNQFYGGQLGLRGEVWRGKFFLNAGAKVALGSTHQEVTRSGTTTITTPDGVTREVPAGLLVLASNSGRVSRDAFTVVPEGTINVGYQVTPSVRAFAGYTFLYWSDVARPGDQIDRTLNLNQVPTSTTFGTGGGPARPAPTIKSTDFWAQGINLGLELRF